MSTEVTVDTLRNPWIVTFVGSGGTVIPLVLTHDMFTVDRIEWTSQLANQNDELQVSDCPPGVAAGSGRVFCDIFASGADTFRFTWQKTVRPQQGICINVLSSGVARLFYA